VRRCLTLIGYVDIVIDVIHFFQYLSYEIKAILFFLKINNIYNIVICIKQTSMNAQVIHALMAEFVKILSMNTIARVLLALKDLTVEMVNHYTLVLYMRHEQ
jgi:hypothetical protein